MTDFVIFAKNTFQLDNPGLIVALLAVCVALLFVRPRWGRRSLVAFVLAFWFVSTPGGSWLLRMPLVRGFQAIADPAAARSAGAIVVLGGGVRDMKAGAEVYAYPHEGTTLRLLEAARVFRLMGGRAPVVASGGFTAAGRRVTEAAVMARVLATLGVPPDRILLEEQSRNTHEQAIHVAQLLRSRGIATAVLVTAPTHMWRAAAVFRAEDLAIVPSPAALFRDYTPARTVLTPNRDSLQISDEAIYDYAGIVYYWWRGWLRPAAPEAAR